MCPSYMVTREEEHSTRGRARLLFEMIRGEVITDGWRSTEVRDALDLCLACKGCKSDCPVDVDMATYKAEFLAHHYRHRLRPRGALLDGLAAGAGPGSPRSRRVPSTPSRTGGCRRAGQAAGRRGAGAGAADVRRAAVHRLVARPRRARAAQASAARCCCGRTRSPTPSTPRSPRSAVEVLEDAGFEVRVPTEPVCCGLTWVSTGQLATARRVLRRTLRVLRDDIRAGVPVVGLEPSCTAVFRSDGPELLSGDEDMRRLARQTRTLAELLDERASDWEPPRLNAHALVQTHCHQHAVLGAGKDDALMARAGVDAERLASGCCGLAGNFGFERGHYEVSRAAGERVLLPRVRAADPRAVVLADGFSCRTQIEQGDTGRTAVHLAELLAAGVAGRQLGDLPERVLADRPGGRHETSTRTTHTVPEEDR